VINFVIIAFALFMTIRALARLRLHEIEKPAAPSKPSAEVELLMEIRDLLKTAPPR
jgi:large conductance mechanosensitive channel